MKAVIPLFCLLTLSASNPAGGHDEDYEPSPYHYEYQVHDDKEYLDFGAEEEGDGKGDVHGSYRVQLPDGRLQKVTYRVDDYNGYVAEVTYDGHAEHPSYHGSGGHGGGGHGGGHRFGKALRQNVREHSILDGSAGSRLGKSFVQKSTEHSFSDDFFGSSSQQSHITHSESSSRGSQVIKPVVSLAALPELREASFHEVKKSESELNTNRRTFVSKLTNFEEQHPQTETHKFFQHKAIKPKSKGFPIESRTHTNPESHTASIGFVSKPSSFKPQKLIKSRSQEHKPQTVPAESKVPERHQSSHSRIASKKHSNFESSHFEPTQASTRFQSSPRIHPVLSSINSLRSDPVGQKSQKHKSSLIVHRLLPTQ